MVAGFLAELSSLAEIGSRRLIAGTEGVTGKTVRS